jgi:Bacterial nucleoid DNA-binding protein
VTPIKGLTAQIDCLAQANETGYFGEAQLGGEIMTKAFVASVIKDVGGTTSVEADRATIDVLGAIVEEIKKNGRFTLYGFGTFMVRKLDAKTGFNPRTGERLELGDRKTVRFKPSPSLRNKL